MESPFGEEWLTSSSIPVLLELVWASSKMSLSPFCGHLCELSLGHQAQGPIYYFRTNHEWVHLGVGRGWYDQHQHILIITFDLLDLEVDLHLPKVWDG